LHDLAFSFQVNFNIQFEGLKSEYYFKSICRIFWSSFRQTNFNFGRAVFGTLYGGLIGLQLDYFLEIKCAVRGTCYGDDSFAYNASLVHPLVIKLFLSSIALMGVSLLLKSGLLFNSLKTAGVMSESDGVHVKKMASALLNLGGIFLLLSIPLIVMSWGA